MYNVTYVADSTSVLKWEKCFSFGLTFIKQLLFALAVAVPRTRWQMPGWSQHHFPTIGYFTSMSLAFDGVLFGHKDGFIKAEAI